MGLDFKARFFRIFIFPIRKYRNFVATHVVIASHLPRIATSLPRIATINLRNVSIDLRNASISDDITAQLTPAGLQSGM
uniref:Uncharacterized protein n=1 Tax=Candidatus Kentrum sp. LPFa TaxID=2126335 RepID=A0A450WFG4_9GAMM|nr:MAG: hypothetical protein BECKLPF1236A_GA0070988_101319 [Candidatus Kentron sp. LPFa]VFK31721.1 MAG: hypothetical protein BECKLPF1236C_GA0070990_101478 [Candidatus Kentron sp. LPFa]